MNIQSRCVFWAWSWEFSDLRFCTQFLHYLTVSNHFSWGGGGGVNPFVEVNVNSKEENSSDFFVPLTSKNSASGYFLGKAGCFFCSFEVLHRSQRINTLQFLITKNWCFLKYKFFSVLISGNTWIWVRMLISPKSLDLDLDFNEYESATLTEEGSY